MSGRKETYVTITARERDRLYQQAAQATNLARANQALASLAQSNDRALQESRRQQEALTSRLRTLDDKLAASGQAARKEAAALRAQLQQEVRAANQRLRQEAQRNQRQLEALGESFDQALRDTRQDVADAMAANNRRIEQAIDRSAQALRQEVQSREQALRQEMGAVERRLDGLQARVQSLDGSNATLLEMAREYEEMTDLLLEDAAQYRSGLLLPGQGEQAQAAAAQARSQRDLCQQAPTNAPVARDYARQAFERALDYHQRLLQAEQAWQMDLRLTRQAVDAARAQLEASRTLSLPECQVDVDRWTGGDLGRLAQRLEGLDGVLRSPESLSGEDLASLRAAAVQVSRELDEAAGFALAAVTSSQDRAETAAHMASQLWDAFSLQVVSHGYQGDDQRGAHRIHLKNPATGFEMVVTQTPQADEEGRVGNCLESDILHYGTFERNAGEADALARRVLEALGGQELEQSEVRTVPGYESRSSDRTQLTQRQAWDQEQPAIPAPKRRREGQAAVS